jgi:hypothetical protein
MPSTQVQLGVTRKLIWKKLIAEKAFTVGLLFIHGEERDCRNNNSEFIFLADT